MKSGLYRSRTDTPVRAVDFESTASANSAKRPAWELPVPLDVEIAETAGFPADNDAGDINPG
jgi:hypothetical protein